MSPVLDKLTRTPGGRFAFTMVPAGSFTKVSHPITTYSDVFDLGEWEWLQVIMDIYATSVTDAGDVLDVTIELSTNGVLYYKVGQFTQQAGNGVAAREVITLENAKAVDADAIFAMVAAATVVDEKTFGRYARIGIGVTDNDTNGIHQFKVTAYIK